MNIKDMDEFDKKLLVREFNYEIVVIMIVMFFVGMFSYQSTQATELVDLICNFILMTFYLLGTIQLKNDIIRDIKRIVMEK